MAICQKSTARPRRVSDSMHQVVVADAGAAGGDQQVDAGHLIGDGGDGVAVVAGDRQHDRLAAAGAHQGGQGVRVGTDDAAGGDRLAGQRDLVAGGQDRDARAAMHGDPGMVGGGGQADIARSQAAPGGDHGVAGGKILPGAADVPPGGARPR